MGNIRIYNGLQKIVLISSTRGNQREEWLRELENMAVSYRLREKGARLSGLFSLNLENKKSYNDILKRDVNKDDS